jgi:hypothetical protein
MSKLYKLSVSVENPMLHDSRGANFQFDQAEFDEAMWAEVFPPVKELIDLLVESSEVPDNRFAPIKLLSKKTLP